MNSRPFWWLPSIGTFLWLAFFFALTLSPTRIKLISADGDPCWHWRQGNWMIDNLAIQRTDTFSHTKRGAPMIQMWWLSEILLAGVGNWLGWNGIVILTATIIASTLWLLHYQLLSEENNPLLCILFSLLAASVCAIHWLARPHLFTHLFALVFAWRLRAFSRGKCSTKHLFILLPALMLVWVNLHGAFITGLVLIGCYLCGTTIAVIRNYHSNDGEKYNENLKQLKIFALLFITCLVTSLINPNVWHLHVHVLGYLGSDTLVQFVDEYASPDFHDASSTGLILLLLTMMVTLAIARNRLTANDVVLTGVWSFFALHTIRNAPVFALVATPIIVEHLTTYLRVSRWKIFHPSSVSNQQYGGAPWILIAIALALVASPRYLVTDIPSDKYPVAAVNFLRKNPSVIKGQMFNDVTWGGYFVLAMPEHKVFIDGRIDFYGEELIEDFNIIDEIQYGWEEVRQKYNVNWTILPRRHVMNQLLALNSDWEKVYDDPVAIIYRWKQL